MKNFCVAGKIGIGVILYEKGKGKFVGDWKKPTAQKLWTTNFAFSSVVAI